MVKNLFTTLPFAFVYAAKGVTTTKKGISLQSERKTRDQRNNTTT